MLKDVKHLQSLTIETLNSTNDAKDIKIDRLELGLQMFIDKYCTLLELLAKDLGEEKTLEYIRRTENIVNPVKKTKLRIIK